MTDIRRAGTNNLGALYSFLRVLAVAEASALLPLFVGTQQYPTLRAMGLATIPAFLLTAINYLRPGEVRFGSSAPNVVRDDDAGTADLFTIGAVLLALGVLLLLLDALAVIAVVTVAWLILILIGTALLVFSGSRR